MRRRRNVETIAGRVNSDGTVALGEGFSVQKSGTGFYIITIQSPGFRLITATTALIGIALWTVCTDQHAERSFRVGLVNAAQAATDGGFSFIAVGYQQ